MAIPPEKTKLPQLSAKERRERRLADVLRANLKRRKAGSKASTSGEALEDGGKQDSEGND